MKVIAVGWKWLKSFKGFSENKVLFFVSLEIFQYFSLLISRSTSPKMRNVKKEKRKRKKNFFFIHLFGPVRKFSFLFSPKTNQSNRLERKNFFPSISKLVIQSRLQSLFPFRIDRLFKNISKFIIPSKLYRQIFFAHFPAVKHLHRISLSPSDFRFPYERQV